MKKLTAILLTTALLAALTGCNKTEGNSDSAPSSSNSSDASTPSSSDSPTSTAPESSDNGESTENSESEPEKKQPDGEPTFLKGLDGETIYTSEITQLTTYDLERKENVPTDTIDPENFSAVCEGFTYVYTPRPSVDFMSHPELFEAYGDHYYYYAGALPDSTEFVRVNVGDKIGGLTVKAASCSFTNLGYEGSEQFYEQGNIEYDGEVELTGFVIVYEEAPLYPGGGGDILFYPDSASSVKIPRIGFDINYEDEFKARRFVEKSFYGWYGDGGGLSLGNIADIDSELREGDMYVKVKVTVCDIVLGSGSKAAIKEIELI